MTSKRKKFADYPHTPNLRSGAKVGWRYYDREIDAMACARAAKINADIKWDMGYDFGYCAPGSIHKIPEDSDGPYAGKFEVCVP